MGKPSSQPLFYVVKFFVIFVVLYALYGLAEPYVSYYYAALAGSVCHVFGWFDASVACDGNYLLYDGVRSLVVVEGCDGITFVALILAAVLPFPAPWRDRLIGLAWLLPAVLILNWLRLAVLTYLQFYATRYFDFVHVYLFQPMMIFFTLIIFLTWIAMTGRKRHES